MLFKDFYSQKPVITILAEGYWGTRHAKTAYGVIRYGSYPINSVIDGGYQGLSDGNIKILKTLEEALNQDQKPQALLLGIAPIGGQLP
ncbi:MAG: hypothetical protein LW817_00680, partial [Candidatus Caenarcaniphilales bacterium]|nr:hypothetical protein [Candidatus Caenarcaniphilales bacterium]